MPATDPNVTRLDNHKRAVELFALFTYKFADGPDQCLACVSGKADQDNAGGVFVANNEDEPAKIFVFGD